MVLNDGQRHKTAYKESAVTDKWGSGRGETCETCLSGTLWEVCLDAARGGEFEARSGVERRGRLNWPRLWCDAARGITFLGVSAESTLGELAPEPPTDPPWPQPPHEPPPRSPPRSPPPSRFGIITHPRAIGAGRREGSPRLSGCSRRWSVQGQPRSPRW